MDNSALYGVMVFAPVVIWICKLSLSYRIQYDLLPRFHGKHYIRRHKKGFWNGYFCMCFRDSLSSFVFGLNFVLGWWLLLSLLASPIYLILWIAGHEMILPAIAEWQIRLIIIAWTVHLVMLVVDRVKQWIRKK